MLRLAKISALALGLAACGRETQAEKKSAAGAELFISQGCATCHAQDGAGTPFGPTLHGKKAFWTREKLVVYLKDPVGYAEKEPRLSAQARRFTLPMQRFDKLTPEELAAIADHILSMP